MNDGRQRGQGPKGREEWTLVWFGWVWLSRRVIRQAEYLEGEGENRDTGKNKVEYYVHFQLFSDIPILF